MQVTLCHKKLLFLVITLLIFGSLVGYSSQAEIKKCTKDYLFLNQSIDCSTINEKIVRVANLEKDVKKTIDEEVKKNTVTRVSVFYRNLETKRWFDINDEDFFYPASLVKLPLSIAYYKLSENGTDILNQKLQISAEYPDQNARQYFKIKNTIIPGNEYTINQMLIASLVNSDNNPLSVLNQNLGSDFRIEILQDLGITEEKNITAYDYGNIFRSLYNGSYLNLQNSEKILEYLSQSEFNEGIRAGIPQNIKVAHKFGEAALAEPDGTIITRVLHDCGIVYIPKNPFIICIMTEGKDIPDMAQVIKNITQMVYDKN